VVEKSGINTKCVSFENDALVGNIMRK
jgi:hypothetical protein